MHIKFYERPLLRFIQIGDKLQADRIKRLLQKLLESCKLNKTYWLTMDSLFELILKLSLRSPHFS